MNHQEHVTLKSSGLRTAGTDAPFFDGSQLCAQTDPEAFFPETGSSTEIINVAKRICTKCEFIEPCLQYALDNDMLGIWGGLGERQRARLKRQQKVAS